MHVHYTVQYNENLQMNRIRTLTRVSDRTPDTDSGVAHITGVVWKCGITTGRESGIAREVGCRAERL